MKDISINTQKKIQAWRDEGIYTVNENTGEYEPIPDEKLLKRATDALTTDIRRGKMLSTAPRGSVISDIYSNPQSPERLEQVAVSLGNGRTTTLPLWILEERNINLNDIQSINDLLDEFSLG